MTRWVEFVSWHLRTEHAWDVAFHQEVMRLNIASFWRELSAKVMEAIG